jgi:hypothetical protein
MGRQRRSVLRVNIMFVTQFVRFELERLTTLEPVLKPAWLVACGNNRLIHPSRLPFSH